MTVTELLETVRRVELRTNRLVNDTMVGAYLSHFKGRGMDFEELREYIPGDDVRDIDWNVTNRLGRPFVKRYREERELAAVLAVDVSGSSAFGSGNLSKREFAAEVAATLAISASRNGDKVALLLFTEQVELFIPPRKGRRHILRIVREMLAFEPKKRGTDIPAALAFLNHTLHRRSIVFLLTDFLHSDAGGASVPVNRLVGSLVLPNSTRRDVIQELGITNTRHDLVCLHLHDPRESSLPDAGLLTIEDAETGEILELDSARGAVRDRFAVTNAGRLEELDRALNRTAVDTLRLNTVEPFAKRSKDFLKSVVDGDGGEMMKIFSAILFLFAALSLRAQSGAAETNAPLKLLPPYGELPPTFWEQHGTAVVVGGIAIIMSAAFGLWLAFRSRPKIILPPAVQARQALEMLRSQPEDGAVLSRVSQIVRSYFIAAFQLAPGEFTTAEFNRVISGREKIGAEISTATVNLLRDCDNQKFSPAKTTTPIGAVKRALELIELGESRLAQLRQSTAVPTETKTSTGA